MGLVFICMNGDDFCVYDASMNNSIGECVYRCKLNEIQNLRFKPSLVFGSTRFDHNGNRFKFYNYSGSVFTDVFRQAGLIQ